ncbi:MAG: pyrimidine dimer DNA glycosylase/endonuclease V [Desulfurococcales archaeon]|jgi:hypothetical protein|nr:pyrimidine dimer DNA glycosylase/endonuclease V [Desulfurococcales archaeon]
MRLWSIDPEYIDPIGLVALWRESILALKVIKGHTKGYRNHPQLYRFRVSRDPIRAINTYIYYIWLEGIRRGYRFGNDKFDAALVDPSIRISISDSQVRYEVLHLLKKVYIRSRRWLDRIASNSCFKPHPIFRVVPGDIEPWEKLPREFDKRELEIAVIGPYEMRIRICNYD